MTRERLRDIFAASPIIVWYALAIAGLVLQARWPAANFDALMHFLRTSGPGLASALYLLVTLVLLFVRRLPVAKGGGWTARIITTVALNAALLLLLLPKAQLIWPLKLASSLLILGGTAAEAFVIAHLGRCFAILPQARGLVTSGPYRYARHPLYVAEQLAMLGVALQYQQPWALLVAALSIAAQFPRMRLEEQILAKTFPPYAKYAARTARLLPGLY